MSLVQHFWLEVVLRTSFDERTSSRARSKQAKLFARQLTAKLVPSPDVPVTCGQTFLVERFFYVLPKQLG